MAIQPKIYFRGGALVIRPRDNGSFDVNTVVATLAMAAVAPTLYKVSEDILKEAVNRTPIKTGLLRSTGSVTLLGDSTALIRMKLANKLKTKTPTRVQPGSITIAHREPMRAVAHRALAVMMRSKNLTFTFQVGFSTSYARYIHQGNWKFLGSRSGKANRKTRKNKEGVVVPGRYAGKVGKFYLRRAWTDNSTRYLGFIRSRIGK